MLVSRLTIRGVEIKIYYNGETFYALWQDEEISADCETLAEAIEQCQAHFSYL